MKINRFCWGMICSILIHFSVFSDEIIVKVLTITVAALILFFHRKLSDE